MGNSEQNRKAIAENRKRIFSLDAEVMTNKTLIYASRSMIEENRLMILSNYSAAFMGNRQIANNNTDEIFENRHAILDNVDTQNDVEENFVNSQKNKASLDFLQHRSQLNSAVLEISEIFPETAPGLSHRSTRREPYIFLATLHTRFSGPGGTPGGVRRAQELPNSRFLLYWLVSVAYSSQQKEGKTKVRGAKCWPGLHFSNNKRPPTAYNQFS